jgi:hypothetical protein
VKSRYLAAKVGPAANRREHLNAARKNIDQMKLLYPELGGPQWKSAFDDLRKLIDQELEQK